MTKLPPVQVLERYLRMVAEICERRPHAYELFDRVEVMLEEALAAEIQDPVARMRARRAAQKNAG